MLLLIVKHNTIKIDIISHDKHPIYFQFVQSKTKGATKGKPYENSVYQFKERVYLMSSHYVNRYLQKAVCKVWLYLWKSLNVY